MRAHERLDGLQVINTTPAVPQPWQRVAEVVCDAMLAPPTVPHEQRNGQVRS